MRPAFSSPRQAAAFAALLAVLLALPALLGGSGWLPRRNVYPAIAWKYGPFPWIQKQIFVETGDVDMVFLGSSQIWAAINAPFVQKQLSEQLGREAVVFTLGWPWPGFDASYVIARDLLEHRRVHTMVIYDEGGLNQPHVTSARWFRFGDDSEALAGLPWRTKLGLYGSAVLGMPRQLLSLVRPNLIDDPAQCRPNFWTKTFFALDLAEQRGALVARLAYIRRPDFVPFKPQGSATPADALIYSKETRDAFAFSHPTIEPYQLHFARKLAHLCQERGTRLVFLHTPTYLERAQTLITERLLWPEVLGAPVNILGIPPVKLLAGIRETDVPKLFYEDYHLNQNGQEFFTPLITPGLLRLYAKPTIRH
jgi:hypothetical protein